MVPSYRFFYDVKHLRRDEPTGVSSVMARISGVQHGLQQWNRTMFGNIDTRKKKLYDHLQTCYRQPPSVPSYDHMCEVKSEIAELEARQEVMWQQRARLD